MRRNYSGTILVILAVTAVLLTQGCSSKQALVFDNASFYNADGTFNVEAGKDAYIKMMKYHGYPIFPGLKEKLWVSDYGLGQFTKLGLGAYGFLNEVDGNYMGQDLYLLPGQMLPEHYHLKTDKAGPKMEGWHVRHGVSYVYGEGEPTKDMKAVVPKCHMNGTVSISHEIILGQGETTILNRETARHWQFGGPEGAVISEYATYHDNDGVRHSDPKLRFP
jgi:D-lyxose ketol-isomerase